MVIERGGASGEAVTRSVSRSSNPVVSVAGSAARGDLWRCRSLWSCRCTPEMFGRYEVSANRDRDRHVQSGLSRGGGIESDRADGPECA